MNDGERQSINQNFNLLFQSIQNLSARMDWFARKMPIILPCADINQISRFLSALAPMEAVGCNLVRVGHDGDGGYVMINEGLDNAIAYNFGIGAEVSWDNDLLLRGCQIYQYDHTVEKTPCNNINVHFHKKGLSAVGGGDDEMLLSIGEALESNKHSDLSGLILNIDIEGGEWDVLNNIEACKMDSFNQLVVEFHDIHSLVHPEKLDYMIAALDKVNKTHQVVHVHGNNNGGIGIVNGIALPDVLEVTYLKKNGYSFSECNDFFPRCADKANTPAAEDFVLGTIGRSWKYPRLST